MKALVFSDTHGRINGVVDIINSHKDVEVIIHLGDLVRDVEDLEAVFRDKRFEYVAGNNDFYTTAPNEKIVELGGKRLLITHGHSYRVKHGYYDIMVKGKQLGVDAVLFGHTHVAYENRDNGILYLNPGSPSRPVGRPSYGVVEVLDGEIRARLIEIK